MSGLVEFAKTACGRLMKLLKDGMAAFKQRELEFRKRDREGRAGKMTTPVNTDDIR